MKTVKILVHRNTALHAALSNAIEQFIDNQADEDDQNADSRAQLAAAVRLQDELAALYQSACD